MLKIANFTLVIVTLITASVLYSLEYSIRGHERTIARETQIMVDNAEAIKLLKAEWSSLTRPDRLQALSEQHLGMKTIQPDQYVAADQLPQKLQALVPVEAKATKPTIDSLLEKMR